MEKRFKTNLKQAIINEIVEFQQKKEYPSLGIHVSLFEHQVT